MKHLIALTTFAATLALSGAAYAGPIERACLKSDRAAASRSLCGCIQNAADATLTGGEQRKAASFFRDPHRAQVTRQSDRASDERFWGRYKRFSSTAQRSCG